MPRRRLLYLVPVSVSTLTAVLAVVALHRGLEGRQAVFPGFFFHVNGTVAALQRGGWEGPANGIEPGDLIVGVNGRVLHNGRELKRWLAKRRIGELVQMQVEQRRSGQRRIVQLRLRRLTTGDFLATFVLPFGIGVVYLLLGAVVFFVKRTYEAALAMSVCVVASVYHMTTFDAHTTQSLVRLWVAYPLLGAVAVHLFAVFPAVRPRMHRPLVLAVLYGIAAATLTVIEVNVTNPKFAAVSSVIPVVYLAICFFICIALLSMTITAEPSEVIRNKARTIRLGLLLTAAAGVAWSLIVRVSPELITAERAMMVSALFPVLLAYAVIKKNLFDIQFVLRTTAVYAVATALVLALYFGVVFVIGLAMSALTQRYAVSSLPAAVVSTLVVALAFHPLRVGVQRVVDRFFFREKGTVERALLRLTQDLPSEAAELPELGRRLTTQARELLRCRFVALLCPDILGNEYQVVSVAGEASERVRMLVVARDSAVMDPLLSQDPPIEELPRAEEEIVNLLDRGEVALVTPLRSAESLAGVLIFGPRPHGDVFTRHDRDLLRRLAPSAGLVVQNALLLREHAEKERLAALGKLAAVMIHEIKNPLGIIRVSSGTLKKRFVVGDSGHELASFIEEEVVRMNHTIAQFLSFARPQQPTLAPFDLAELVQRTTSAAEGELHDAGITLEVELERPVQVLADAAQVQQVLLNLLVNARQALAGREDGRVRVVVRRRSEVGEMVIEDNGPGIDRADRERVFEPFYTTRRGGTGLGLAIVRQLLTEQGGRVKLQRVEGGTRFLVRLPSSP